MIESSEERMFDDFNDYLCTYNDILNFISRFSDANKCFLHGCCYWFCNILFNRFVSDCNAVITVCYNQIEGHFVTKFYFPLVNITRVFDVRGDVTDLYNIDLFKSIDDILVEDKLLHDRLHRDCVRMTT